MSKLKFIKTPLNNLFEIEREIYTDSRGEFFRVFCKEEIKIAGIRKPLQQINITNTDKKYVTKGIHYQKYPHAECKLITCIKGSFFDVAVDLRKDSATYLQWHSVILSEINKKSILIPEGFGHGFQALEENSSLLYLHTESYHPESEGGINVCDSVLSISWPHTPTNLSDRDKSFPFIEMK